MGAVGRALILAVATTLVAGCQHVSPAKGIQSTFTFTPEERGLSPRFEEAGRPKLAVVMSGGGIRSSLYNFGALKALYDEGLLQQTDLISSVSGGSYLSYWLYTEQAKSPDAPFAAPLFDNANFGKRLCEFTGKANFVPYQSMATHLLSGKALYEARMKAVFGGADRPTDDFPQLAGLVKAGRAPYLVVNSTVYGVRYNNLPWT
ncbi:MAG: patatin-like phospholipase family protein, partial [Pseudomonas sp.]